MNIRILCCILGTAALLVACSEPEPPRAPTEIVAERAQARWDAMVRREFETAWQYYAPGFRQQLPAEAFAGEMAIRPLKWTAAEILEVDCPEKAPRCEVRARVDYQVPAGLPGVGTLKSKAGVKEIWLQIDGKWWYSPNS